MIRYDDPTYLAVSNLAFTHKVWVIIGSDDQQPADSKIPGENEYFNSSFLMSPDGQLVERYCKRQLVIFGEYVPLVKWLPFIKHFTPIDGSFTPGKSPVPFRLGNLRVNLSVLICFEDVFPHLDREYVRDDTDFLVNITNDGWFGEGAAQWQQAAGGVFRAVENGVPLVRCSNNGLTCLIDSSGRMVDIFRDEKGTIYGPGFMKIEVPLRSQGTPCPQTYYNRHGDVFGRICIAFGALVLVRQWMKRHSNSRQIKAGSTPAS